jgi:tryptophan-rich sensory protein
MKKALSVIVAIIICQLAGTIGTLFTTSQIPTWYATLVKPSFQPPNYLFGPVWLTLYTLMGISLYLIWRAEKGKERKQALWLFGIQLFLNAIWSPIFFGWHRLDIALVVIILMWVFILATIIRFYKLNKPAAYLLIPYILWVSFASVLNYAILVLN